MKRILFTAIILASSYNLFAQAETQTETETKKEKEEIKIYLNNDKSFYMSSGLFSMGWNIGLNMPKDIDNANTASMYVMWDVINFTKELGSKQDQLSFGLGMIWNKYATSHDGMFLKGDGEILTGKGTSNLDYSRYLTYALDIPLQYTHICKNGMYYSVGASVNFNLYSSVFNETREGNTITEVTQKHAYHNPITMDFRAQIGYKGIGLMVKYSPMRVIKKNYGPDFQSIGFGIVATPNRVEKKIKKAKK